MATKFTFRNPPTLQDQELTLELHKTVEGDPTKGWVPAYFFHMIHRDTGAYMGKIDLRIGDNENLYYGGHIGYEVEEHFRGQRYAARSVQLLLPFAKDHGLETIGITCNPDNVASRRTCEIAGGVLQGIVDLPEHNNMYHLGDRQKCRYLFTL